MTLTSTVRAGQCEEWKSEVDRGGVGGGTTGFMSSKIVAWDTSQ